MKKQQNDSGYAPQNITDLLSARLHALAGMSAAATTLSVERKFGISLLEWRSIAHLGGFAPLSLKELARRAGLDKSYASRTISGLIERELVVSGRNAEDARGVMLRLTPKGQTLYKKAFADAVARNERLLRPLSDAQREHLMDALNALAMSARRALDDERRASAGEPVEADLPAGGRVGASASASAPPGPSAIDLGEIRYLVSRLSELVDGR
jgi:DNA-binding MarR family transcriptional regulator